MALLHYQGLVHGDLTTSNVMLRDPDQKVILIDFGLAYPSHLAEDKGVDLYVLERAITSAHDGDTEMFQAILRAYERASKKAVVTLARFRDVRMRGRKRPMIG